MIRIHFILFITLVVGVRWLSAAETLIITLHNVGDRVRAQNLDLKAAKLVVDEALGLERQSGRLSNPKFEISAQANDRFAERGLEVGFNQKFPLTGRLQLEKQRSATAVAAARQEIAVAENRLVGQARELVVEVLAIRGRQALLKQQVEVARKLAEFTREAADKAEASLIDAGQAKLETSRIEAECLQLEALIKQTSGELKPLLGMRDDQRLLVSGVLPELNMPRVASTANSPEISLARLEVRGAEQQLELEKANRYEDVEAGVFAGLERTIDAPEVPEREAIVGLRLSVPLPLWDRNQGQIEAADARAERRRAELLALERRLSLKAGALREEMRQWAGLAAEVERNLLPLAAEQTDLAEKAWRNGRVSLLSVMKSREQGIQLAMSRLDALKNYHLACVRYLTLLGGVNPSPSPKS